MTIPEISAATTSARALLDLFKALVGLGMDSQVQIAVIDAQRLIIELQGQLSDIRDKFDRQAEELYTLREKLREKEDWNETAAKYERRGIAPLTYVYILKKPEPLVVPGEYCAFCFGNKKIVLLQDRYCHECKMAL